ncbi:MAG TPA: cytochrome c oxidase subunit 3 family protein [Polyangiaceae bacterium]|nr:cytochrome c oxidase subunit 3 family protein [Polyangiaceae bacterium]
MNAPESPSALPERAAHFDSPEQRERAAHLGMWLFLTSETLLFGALFGVYTGYRLTHSAEFHAAARSNDAPLGTLNTLILISSSFFAAWAVHAARHEQRRTVLRCLLATLVLGAGFLVVKAVEYAGHFAHGIYPGAHYRYAELPSEGARLFFTLYFFMTGLHALHVIGGLVTLGVLALLSARRPLLATYTPLELGVLYWHLVDAVWIFLWPLLYLAG